MQEKPISEKPKEKKDVKIRVVCLSTIMALALECGHRGHADDMYHYALTIAACEWDNEEDPKEIKKWYNLKIVDYNGGDLVPIADLPLAFKNLEDVDNLDAAVKWLREYIRIKWMSLVG